MPEGREPSEFLEQVGLAATVMGQSPQYCEYPIACIQRWLEPAIRHNQIKFFRNESRVAVGYITWAWLAEDAEFRLMHDRSVLLHINEWNEGERLWILDFVLLSGDIHAVAAGSLTGLLRHGISSRGLETGRGGRFRDLAARCGRSSGGAQAVGANSRRRRLTWW
jgi:hemolysin-activating ACP:hemolysin acyltransferase